MEFIHEYLWYMNQCFDFSALRASQSLLFENLGEHETFEGISKHCDRAFFGKKIALQVH